MNKQQPKILNLANLLTLSRVAAIPILVILLLFEARTTSILAALLFLAATLTDLLDGFLARRRKLVTNFGRFLDPLADKLLNSAALIMLIPLGRVAAWMVFLIIGRDLAVTGLRAIASTEGIVIDASLLGKRKTLTQNIAICLLLAHYPIWFLNLHTYGTFLLWVALVITYWSGIAYFIKFYKVVGADTGRSVTGK
ncbi:MAG: CDP-diacylglycerol--glycerol-3-phosphate 3-phosphatidyltransferase [Deltaproteobacteria bacterium]|nr:CDP-diacylglycerol--glycerol-3-phosphate 3-phosphatidyltransferase [Deltaproteobacteria bacterium]